MSIGGNRSMYAVYVAAQHVEGKAAIQMRESGSAGGTMHHNNPNGICVYCRHALPTLLPEGATLTVVPPTDARAPSGHWIDVPTTFVGNEDDPSSHSDASP